MSKSVIIGFVSEDKIAVWPITNTNSVYLTNAKLRSLPCLPNTSFIA